jgi:hypothetical protein
MTETPVAVRVCRPLSPNTCTITHDARHLVEIADRELGLGQDVDRTDTRGGRAGFERDLGAKLALGDQYAVGQAQLASNEQKISAANIAHVVGNRRWRDRQHDPEICELLLGISGHRGLLLTMTLLAAPRGRFAGIAAAFRGSPYSSLSGDSSRPEL